MIIVGIGHKSRQGKDSFATFLISHLRMNSRNKKIIRMGFADPLKGICYQLYAWAGLQPKEYYDNVQNEHKRNIDLPLLGKPPVRVWIDVGNHMRKYDNDVWMRALLKGTVADVLVIPDVRFPNEAQAVLDHGGFLIKIVRPDFPGLNSDSDNALNTFDGWTHTINNDAGLRELNNKAIEFGVTNCQKVL